MSEETNIVTALDQFFAEGQITDIVRVVKSGKEATVYCCQAHRSQGVEYLAAKVYRERNDRSFKNDAVYQEGRVILDGHARRAVKNKSRFGREVQSALWIGHEYEALETLYRAGADIPKPIAQASSAILIEYMGDGKQAAPVLNDVRLERGEAQKIFSLLLRNIRLWLTCNYVHADLSAFNILYWNGTVKVIDFPQAVDPRFNTNALSLLTRDIENVYRYLSRYGVKADPTRLAQEYWDGFLNNRL